MTFHKFIMSIVHTRRALLILSLLGLSACAVVGPNAISAGRGAYTEVINRTEDEQILNVLVRQRYDETFGMISVASVTANLRFSARAGTDIGIGDRDNYEGNLVPLSAGVGYEENPTISYVPLTDEDFMRRMLSPISANDWITIASISRRPGQMLSLAVNRVNGLRNPLVDEESPPPEFTRLVDLYGELRLAGVLDIVNVAETGDERRYAWDIHDYKDAHHDRVREFLDLLSVEVKPDGSPILLPLIEAFGSSVSSVHLRTRSAYDIFRVFGSGIEVPPTHLEAGIVEPSRADLSESRRFITIRSSEERPDNATVRIRYRDWWFYIDATDTQSKRAFMFLRVFIGMRLASSGSAQNAPVITIPVN